VRENNAAFREMFALESDEAARKRHLADFFENGEDFSRAFEAAKAGETLRLRLAAKNGVVLNSQFSPNNQGRHNYGVVCCFLKV
jgi:hypothetical protein